MDFAADIDDVGPRVEERAALCGRGLGIEPQPPIGKAVGCHIEDTHDKRAVEGEPRPRRPRRRKGVQLLARVPRKAGAAFGKPRFEAGNRGGHRDRAPVRSKPDSLYQGEGKTWAG